MTNGELRSGSHVYLRVRPAITGTIGRVTRDGFTVTYDFPARKPHEPRSRFRYPWDMRDKFISGEPPVTS